MSLDSQSESVRHPAANFTRYQPNSLCVWKLVTTNTRATESAARRTLSFGFDDRFELEAPLPDWSTHYAPGSSAIEAHDAELKNEYAGDRCIDDSLELREGFDFSSQSADCAQYGYIFSRLLIGKLKKWGVVLYSKLDLLFMYVLYKFNYFPKCQKL